MAGSGVRNGWGSTPSQSIGFVLGSALFLCWTLLVVISLSSIVFYSMKLRIILGCSWPLQFVLCYTLANFNILYLGFCKSSLPRMFPPLDMISEFRIQLDIIGPLRVTSILSAGIFYRGVSGFATDCPCGVWCRGSTTCLLYVGPPFGNQFKTLVDM